MIGPAVRGGDDAGRRGPRVSELEEGTWAAVIEEALPIAENERMDKQDELIDEPLGEELTDDLAAAQDHDVLAVLLPDRRDRLRELAVEVPDTDFYSIESGSRVVMRGVIRSCLACEASASGLGATSPRTPSAGRGTALRGTEP